MAVSLALFANMTAVSFAAEKEYYLPTSAQYYSLKTDENGNVINNAWVKGYKETFKYNKRGHLTKYTRKSNVIDQVETTKWQYKKDRIVSRKTTMIYKGTINGKAISTGYYKKGRLTKLKEERNSASAGKYTSTSYFTYNKKNWVTEVKTAGVGRKNYKITFNKNGMPKSIKSTLHLNYHDSKSGYNKKGLPTGTSSLKRTYTYDKKGRVKTCWIKSLENGKYVTTRKIVYKYGKNKTTDKRVYFGIMARGDIGAMISRDVIPGDLVMID